jgi:hypothetical protein
MNTTSFQFTLYFPSWWAHIDMIRATRHMADMHRIHVPGGLLITSYANR